MNAYYIDSSTLKYFMQCPQSYEYYAVDRRQSEGARPGMNFGSAWHLFMRPYYTKMAEGITMTPSDIVEIARDSMREHFAKCPQPLGDHRELSFAIRLATAYAEEYPSERFNVVSHNNKPLVECPFAVHLCTFRLNNEDIPVIYTGRIDIVVEWPDVGIQTMDHKTSSRGGSSYFDEYINDQSQIGYAWALWKTCGIIPTGFTINAIITKKNIGPESFLRQRIPLDKDRLIEWEDNTIETIGRIFDSHQRNKWPMFSTHCVGKYGKCQYLDVCALGRSRRKVMLQSGMFEDVKWTPLD